jgi:hypothetical protein
MEEANTSDFTSYILLCVSGLLVFIDSLELAHIISNWQYTSLFILPMFDKCIKYELISKTIFALFSLVSALSAFFLSFFLLFFQSFFLQKFLDTFLFVNYIIFGPLMLILSLLGMHYWDEVAYVCEKNNLKNKEISASNTMTIAGCFLISFILTLLVEFFTSFNFLLDSIMKREYGSPIIGKFFWKVVTLRTNRDRIRAYNRNVGPNNNALSENIENNNDNEANNRDNDLIDVGGTENLSNGNYRLVNNNNDDNYNCDFNSNILQQNKFIIVNEDHIDIRDETPK